MTVVRTELPDEGSDDSGGIVDDSDNRNASTNADTETEVNNDSGPIDIEELEGGLDSEGNANTKRCLDDRDEDNDEAAIECDNPANDLDEIPNANTI